MKKMQWLAAVLLLVGISNPMAANVGPVLDRVINNCDRTYTAYFGYYNNDDTTVTIPVGSKNQFNPSPIDRGQPTVLKPGRQYAIFPVVFNGSNLVWNLNGRTATASKNAAKNLCQAPNQVMRLLSTTATTRTQKVLYPTFYYEAEGYSEVISAVAIEVVP